MIENHIKVVDSKEDSVNTSIMFRPTHFAVLFAIVLCATALPAPPSSLTPDQTGKSLDIGQASKQPILGTHGVKHTAAKGDLDTDATEYWGYRYNNYNYGHYGAYVPTVYTARAIGYPQYWY